MSTLKLGQGLLLLGAAGVGAGVLGVFAVHTSDLLWLAAAGAAAFALGLVVLAAGALSRN